MFDAHNKYLVFMLYDGIENSVFSSQVLQPLLARLEEYINLEIFLVSFEKKRPVLTLLNKIIPAHDRLHLVLCRKTIFWGKLSLWFSTYQFKKFLQQTPCHEIITRGPLAGYIAINALNKLSYKFPEKLRKDNPEPFPRITIQARGLCAEEYRYTTQQQKNSWVKKVIYKIIYNSLNTIEFEVYRNKRKTDYPNDILIEAVSPALKNYLITHFRAEAHKIQIATRDLPKMIIPSQVSQWRQEIRQNLHIPEQAIVYCYSGSFKAWQCAEQSIDYFIKNTDSASFLLILSQDKNKFIKIITQAQIPNERYLITTVSAQDIYKYLSAADYGFLFREQDVVNWVSRPTKMLEYQAVGLKIIHNNTIAWLAEQKV